MIQGGHTLINDWGVIPTKPLIGEPADYSTILRGVDGSATTMMNTNILDYAEFGGGHTHNTYDTTNALIAIWFTPRLPTHLQGVDKYIITLYSNITNLAYRRFIIGTRSSLPTYQMAVIDPNDATAVTVGDFNPKGIIRSEFHIKKYGMNNTFHLVSKEFLITPYQLTGVVSYSQLVDYCTAVDTFTSINSNNIIQRAMCKIGDGIHDTTLNESNIHFNISNKNIGYKTGVQTYTTINSVVTFHNCIWTSVDPYIFMFNGKGKMVLKNCTIVNAIVSLTNVEVYDTTFSNCSEIQITNSTCINVNIQNSKSTYACHINDFSNINGLTITNCNRGIKITEPKEYIFRNMRFRDNIIDVENTTTVTNSDPTAYINLVNSDIPTYSKHIVVNQDPFQLRIINTVGLTIYVEDENKQLVDYQHNYKKTTYVKAISKFDKEWKVVLKKAGYQPLTYVFVPRLSGDTKLSGLLVEDLAEGGVPLYTNLNTTGVSIHFDFTNEVANICISTTVTTQKIYNAIENAMVSIDGMRWLASYRQPMYFPSALGNILILHTGWVLKKASNTIPTVLGVVQTTSKSAVVTNDDINIVYAGGSVLTMQNVRDALTMQPTSIVNKKNSIDNMLSTVLTKMATKTDVWNAALI